MPYFPNIRGISYDNLFYLKRSIVDYICLSNFKTSNSSYRTFYLLNSDYPEIKICVYAFEIDDDLRFTKWYK